MTASSLCASCLPFYRQTSYHTFEVPLKNGIVVSSFIQLVKLNSRVHSAECVARVYWVGEKNHPLDHMSIHV